MRAEESRRLTGPSLLSDRPGAVLEALLEPGENRAAVHRAWSEAVRRLHGVLELPEPVLWVREYRQGMSLGFEAAPDALYAATELNERALAEAALTLGLPLPGLAVEPDGEARLREAWNREASPGLRALIADAERRGLQCLLDDELVTLGEGARSRTWAREEAPAPERVEWERLGSVPVALVTGTNGKTTSTRLAARVLEAGGKVVGHSSTDGISIGEEQARSGDWTGPGAARVVLRDSRVQAAVLETARGGLLRRGLAVTRCDAALITNVAADHLGEYGIETVDEMATVKLVVTRVVRPGGAAVLNADDPLLVAHAAEVRVPVVWFTFDPEAPLVRRHLAGGGQAVVLADDWIVLCDGERRTPVVQAAELPVTYGGAARFNVANALGAAALGWAMGAQAEAIAAGLRSLRPDTEHNPARVNAFELQGRVLLLDFAHNPHGVAALLEFVDRRFRGAGRVVIAGQAGDRDDEAIRELARTVARGDIRAAVLRPIHGYLRGRSEWEVPDILAAELRRQGLPEERLSRASSEAEAIDRALAMSEPGDIVLLLAHVEREAVGAHLQALGAVPMSLTR